MWMASGGENLEKGYENLINRVRILGGKHVERLG
jgi:hypothetical protein